MVRKIRVRHAGGSSTIAIGSTAKDVGKSIEALTQIPLSHQAWKCGYPPKQATFFATEPLPPEIDSIHVSKGEQPSLQFAPPQAKSPKDNDGPPSLSSKITLPFDIGSSTIEPPKVDPEGYVVRRVVDADNSCLFHSICKSFKQPQSVSQSLREAVAQTVLSDPITYSEAFLGRPNLEYANWIQSSDSWGGQIELCILSQLLQTEIVALDIIRNRHDVYGGDGAYKRRIYVIYDGIHYDAVAYCFDPQLPAEMDTTQFSPSDTTVLQRAQDLCAQENQRKAYTDTSNFTLRCLVCQKGLKGQAEAALHAKATAHTNFAEYT